MRTRSKEDKAELWLYHWRIVAAQIDTRFLDLDWVPEHEFAESIGRKYCFDWALPRYKIAVEIDGGNHKAAIKQRRDGSLYAFAIGRHTQDDDYWKRAAAASLGWTVFAFTPEMMAKDPWQAVSFVIDRLQKS